MTNNKNIKNAIDSRLASMTITEDMANRILNQQKVRKKSHRKLIAIAVAACICITISIPVIAANNLAFTSLMALISPEYSQKLQPIELASESNGIKMEVLAAINDNDTAVVYLTFRDLTGKRVDKTLDLYDFSITGADMLTSEVVDYDEKTNTATVRMIGNGGDKLDGKKITVRVGSFLSEKHEYKDIATGIDFVSVINNHKCETVPFNMKHGSGGGGKLYKEFEEKGTIQIVKPDEISLEIPGVDFVNISNIGLIDGRLHIQTKWKESIDNHGYFYLADNSGNRIEEVSNIYLGKDAQGAAKSGLKYIEYIYDTKQVNLENYKLLGDFVENNNFIKGKWQNTFILKSVEKSKQKDCSIDVKNNQINQVSVSPLGITVLGKGNEESFKDINISVTMKDGGVQSFVNVTTKFTKNGEFNAKFVSDKPLNVENVKEVSISGNVIEF